MFFEHQVPMIFSRCWKFERSRHPTTYSEQHFVLFGVFLESFSFVRINENGKKIFSSVDARIKHRRQTRHLCRSLKFFIKKTMSRKRRLMSDSLWHWWWQWDQGFLNAISGWRSTFFSALRRSRQLWHRGGKEEKYPWKHLELQWYRVSRTLASARCFKFWIAT